MWRLGQLESLGKLSYLLWALAAGLRASRHRCPACGSRSRSVVARKWAVTSLCDCRKCGLRYRTPTQTEAENLSFYRGAYRQGFTTTVPTREELTALLEMGFVGTDRDFTDTVALLRRLNPHAGSSLLDFGCSWGYGSWQLSRAGFDVTACEIDARRASYAHKELGINVVATDCISDREYDIFFSAHVIEHVTDPATFVQMGIGVLRPGGLFVAITPNGSDEFRNARPDAFQRLWGRVHPQLITPAWIAKVARNRPFLIGSMPLTQDVVRSWRTGQVIVPNPVGSELVIVVRNA